MRKPSVLIALTLTVAGAVFSQEFRGTIGGIVTDPSGADIVGAKVVATEIRTGTKTSTFSDSAGQYAIPFLAPGDYQIAGSMAGFKEFVRKEIHLGAGEHPTVDIQIGRSHV